MAERGLRQVDLARQLGERRQRVNNWVTGASEIPVDDLKRIANVVGVTVGDLYGEVPHSSARAAKLDEVLARFRSALEQSPERFEINLYVLRGAEPDSEVRESDSNLSEPLPGLRFARQVLDEWPSMSEQERQEWRELAEAIRGQDELT